MAGVVLELPKRDELVDLGGQARLDLAVELQQARTRIDALLSGALAVTRGIRALKPDTIRVAPLQSYVGGTAG